MELQREWAGLIRSASQHLSRLIDDVLEISRIAAGQFSMSLEPVALGPLLHDVLELLRPLATRNAVTLEPVTSPGGHGYAFADSRRLKQVMINLVVNAIKYNRRGGSVHVAVGPGDEASELVRIEVTDTGLGMTAQARAKLFVPFERLATQEYDGPRRVLYVEDTLANIRLIEAILHARPQIELIPAMQGRLGLDLAREHVPDLILLDIHLPDIDGDEVLARLQGDPHTRDIPTVILSAAATETQRKRLLGAGAAAYLTKPIDVARLLETLDGRLAA